MEEIQVSKTVINAASTCGGLMPAFFFELEGHFRADFNKSYVPTTIFHAARQGGNFLSSKADGVCHFVYTNNPTCIPLNIKGTDARTRSRPPRTTQLPIISSTQTAIVVGRRTTPRKRVDQIAWTRRFSPRSLDM